ncbi:unnamed protein product [Allacma fusca]|uniref:BTB domain-containing protein n=1 Tax=Allacma fusca TaxID=39272 RepID=A0A8J2JX98_9HEXA|nr:unnamed protein product [Allacma fusca]
MCVELSRKEVLWVEKLKDIKNETKTVQYVSGDSGRVTSNLEFHISLDSEQRESNFCKLKFCVVNIRKRASTGCTDDTNVHLSFDEFSVGVKLQDLGDANSQSFTKWFHVEFPNNHLEMSKSSYTTGDVLAVFTYKNFISKNSAAEKNKPQGRSSQLARFSCELVIFGVLVEISKHIGGNPEVIPKKKRFEDLSFSLSGSTLLFEFPYPKNISDGSSKDCTVKFQTKNSKKSVEANKFLLAVQSPVLRQMLFETSMIEKLTGVITVSDDKQFPAMVTFLKLTQGEGIYTTLLDKDFQHCLQVISFAHKYQVERVMAISVMVIMATRNSSLSLKDVTDLHSAGKLYNNPDFCARTFQWLKWKGETSEGKDEVMEFLKKAGEEFVLDYCGFLM